MTDATALWAACLDQPADDTIRLVLADLLRESHDPDEQARGRFLWAGVTAAGFRDADLIDDPHYYVAQRELAAVATAGHPAHWLGLLGVGPDPLTRPDWAWDATHDRVTVRIGDTLGTYARGMLAGVAATVEQWLAVARPVLAAWPVERVAVVGTPSLVLMGEHVASPVQPAGRLTSRGDWAARAAVASAALVAELWAPTGSAVEPWASGRGVRGGADRRRGHAVGPRLRARLAPVLGLDLVRPARRGRRYRGASVAGWATGCHKVDGEATVRCGRARRGGVRGEPAEGSLAHRRRQAAGAGCAQGPGRADGRR